jgi:hypothetical protein
MKIRYHVAVGNRLQRSVVELDNYVLARRIVHLVRPEDGSPTPDLVPALWQEHTPGGHEYHNVVNPDRAAQLERQFIQLLISQANSPAPMQDAHGAWRRDSGDVLDRYNPAGS